MWMIVSMDIMGWFGIFIKLKAGELSMMFYSPGGPGKSTFAKHEAVCSCVNNLLTALGA